jgi:hypothetical protein
MKRSLVSATVLALAVCMSPVVHAVDPGEVDTFSAGIENWFAGGGPFGAFPPVPPAVVASGGPGGAGDSFLMLTADGSAVAGGRLVGMNATQWAGDYAGAGIGAIAMDLRNFGGVDLTVRLYFEDPIPGPPLNEAVTTAGVLLPAGGDWVHALFPIGAGDLTVLQGDAATLLANTTVLRIFHGDAPDFPPEPVAGQLGIDNIQAIPEPATVALMALGLGVVALQVRRRRPQARCSS